MKEIQCYVLSEHILYAGEETIADDDLAEELAKWGNELFTNAYYFTIKIFPDIS